MTKKKVLLIDEQVSEIEAVCDVLVARYGEDACIFAQTSIKGLEILQKEANDICCISLDLLMPFQSITNDDDKKKYALEGLYVLKIIKDKYPNIPIFCYSFVKEEFATDFIKKHNAIYFFKGDNNSYQDLLKNINALMSV